MDTRFIFSDLARITRIYYVDNYTLFPHPLLHTTVSITIEASSASTSKLL